MDNNPDWMHADITKAIIGCAFTVSNEPGSGFLESVYERAMVVALKQAGLEVKAQQAIEVSFRGHRVGDFYADLMVENAVLVELKSSKGIAPEHQAQLINYLKATGIEVGLLINFGRPRLEHLRFNRPNRATRDLPETVLPAGTHPVHPVHPCEQP